MLQHRMIGKSELSDNAQALRLGLHAMELNALLGLEKLDPVEHAEKIEMPPGAAELAVGGELEPDLLLPGDDLFNLTILDGLELGRADRALFMFGARFLQGGRTQKAADVIGAEGGFGSCHWNTPCGEIPVLRRRVAPSYHWRNTLRYSALNQVAS